MKKINYLFCSARITFGVLLIAAAICLFIPKFKERARNQAEVEKLSAEIKSEEGYLNELKNKQRQFRTDPRFVELIAHDAGMVKPGETLFKFQTNELQ